MSSIAVRSLLGNADTIGSTSKAVLATLLSYCHGKKDTCFPSLGDMEQVSGFAKRTIRKHLRILEQLGFVETTKGIEYKSNTYKILGLHSEHMNGGTTCPQSNSPEGDIRTIYELSGSQNKKNKTKSIENQSQKNGITPSGVPNQENQSQKNAFNPSVDAQNQSQKNGITPSGVPNQENQSQKNGITPSGVPSVRFEGQFTNELAVKIYTLYCRAMFVQKSTASLLEFLSVCAAILRLKKAKKCRNFYGYLTYIYKAKKTWAIITDADEDRARKKLVELREKGLVSL